MSPRTDLILFLDLETTGTDVPKDEIIEVGLSLVSTEEGYPEIDSFNQVVTPKENAFHRMLSNKVVREMHMKNGLLEEIESLIEDNAFEPIHRVEIKAIMWLDKYVDGDPTHIPLGGSGVTHFDRRFIKEFMPGLDARLTHWAYDVGVMRRMFQKAGVQYANIEAKTHRALDDARVHAEEFRWYQKFIKGE